MLLRSVLLVTFVAVSCVGTAGARGLVYSQSQGFSGQLSPFATSLQFEQINPDLVGFPGQPFLIIEAVVLWIDAEISASVAVENNNAFPIAGVGVQLQGFAVASTRGMEASGIVNVVANSGPLEATDGVPGSGPDYFDFGSVGDFLSAHDAEFRDFDSFVGVGSFAVDVFAAAGFIFSNQGQVTAAVTDFSVEGIVTVEILYSIIPAPSAMPLFGLGLLVVARRRRG